MTRSCIVSIVCAAMLAGCVKVTQPATQPTAKPAGASLWQQPTDLPRRNLLDGPWGRERAPVAADVYKLIERKHTGVNPGMTVKDSRGREWSVKQMPPGGLDNEGPTEVVLSRLLSALGYHQPPVYYLPAFTLEDDWGTHVELGGRFRLKDESLDEVGEWSWAENPFIGTAPYQGLLVMEMMFNATDMKDSNNSLYQYRRGGTVEQWYVVRDLGAALGDTHRFAPLKGDADAFEAHPFILGVQDGFVQFAYKGWYTKLVRNRIRPDDVRWACNLFGQLSDRQWHDAFRAGGFSDSQAQRFIRKLREKIEQGRRV